VTSETLRKAAAIVAYEWTPMTPSQELRMVQRIDQALCEAAAEVLRLRGEVERCREVLRAVEWGGADYEWPHAACCPRCGGRSPEAIEEHGSSIYRDGHQDGCPMPYALGGGE